MKIALRIWLPLVLLLIGTPTGSLAQHDGHDSLAGKLLVADRSMADPRFAETVIYVVSHDENGAFGLVINKPLVRLRLADMLREMNLEGDGTAEQVDLYFGGPVQSDLGFVLHSRDFKGAKDSTMTVQGGYAVSGIRQVLRAISEHKGPEKAIVAIGYAGWSAGQLDDELERGDWVVVDADEALVFDLPASQKWPTALERRSIDL